MVDLAIWDFAVLKHITLESEDSPQVQYGPNFTASVALCLRRTLIPSERLAFHLKVLAAWH